MMEKKEIKTFLKDGKIEEIYTKNFKDENESVFLEIYKCRNCNKLFLFIEIEKKDKIKTNARKLLYDIKMHLSKHNI
ncbi:MAG: hypothetical protein QW184_01900 [Nanopusillaceae archaeon]